MFQPTHTVQDRDNQTANKASNGFVQSFVGILQFVWHVIPKMVTIILNGFHSFVTSAEQPRTTKSDYWWNSRETVDDLFNH